MEYRQLHWSEDLPDDAIMVAVKDDRTAYVRSSEVVPDTPHPMPEALRLAEVWLSREPATYTEIVVRLVDEAEWDSSWGTLTYVPA